MSTADKHKGRRTLGELEREGVTLAELQASGITLADLGQAPSPEAPETTDAATSRTTKGEEQ